MYLNISLNPSLSQISESALSGFDITAFSEIKNDTVDEKGFIFTVSEKMPVFHGVDEDLMNFIAGNLQYSNPNSEYGIQESVVLCFIVHKEGHVRDVEVVRS